jgi:hypothetical protein
VIIQDITLSSKILERRIERTASSLQQVQTCHTQVFGRLPLVTSRENTETLQSVPWNSLHPVPRSVPFDKLKTQNMDWSIWFELKTQNMYSKEKNWISRTRSPRLPSRFQEGKTLNTTWIRKDRKIVIKQIW